MAIDVRFHSVTIIASEGCRNLRMVKLKQLLNYCYPVLKSTLLNQQTFLFIFFSVTNRCNLQCKYCKIPKRNSDELSTKEVFILLDKLKKKGVRRITFCGGEPLLREDIKELVNYSKKKGFYTSLITNSVLVKEKIEDIKNLDTIQLSLDGKKKNHEFHRGKGTYNKLMESFKILRKYSVPVVVSAVLTKHNMEDIDFILKKAEEFDFLVYLNPLLNLPKLTGDTKNMEIQKDKFKKILKDLIVKKKSNSRIVNSKAYFNYLIRSLDNKQNLLKCYAGRIFCHIEPDGSMYPCTNLVGNDRYKNCKKEKLRIDRIKYPCNACVTYGFNEINLLCSFNVDSILNSFRFLDKIN